MISNIHKNIMGTTSFDAQFKGMRKPQDFIVYPMPDQSEVIKIQSDTRIGLINLETGQVRLSQSHASGAYFVHLQMDKPVFDLLALEDRQTLREWIRSTGGMAVGDNALRVVCDNLGAYSV